MVVTIFSLVCLVLCIFCVLPLSIICCVHIFSQYIAYFTLMPVSLDEVYSKFQCCRIYQSFPLWLVIFYYFFKRSFPTLQLQRYSILSFKSYVVLIFIFRSSIHLELVIFVYGVRKEFTFLFLPIWIANFVILFFLLKCLKDGKEGNKW